MNRVSMLWNGVGLRGRLLFLVALFFVLSGSASHGLRLLNQADAYRADLARETATTMDLLAASLRESAARGDLTAIEHELSMRAASSTIGSLQWMANSGAVIRVGPPRPPVNEAPAWFHRYLGIEAVPQAREVTAGGVRRGVVLVGLSGVPLENRLWHETVGLVWRFGLELLAFTLALAFLLDRWLRPLKGITRVGRRFLGGDYSLRVSDSSAFVPEIRAMVDILNRAAEKMGGLVLSLSEQRRATDNAVVVIESDLAGIITYVNDKFCDVTGYSREEVIGQSHRFLNSGRHDRAFFDDLWHTVNDGRTWHSEVCNRTRGGGLIWLLATITPVLGADGRPMKFITVWIDITRRKLAEHVLSQQAQIIDQTHDAVFSTDLDGNLVSWNRGAELLFGYSSHEAIGQAVGLIAPEPERAGFFANVFQGLTKSGGGSLETRLLRKSGDVFDAHFSLTLLKDNDGNDIGLVGYALNITARKNMERALRNSETSLAKAQQMAHLGNFDWDFAADRITCSNETCRILSLDPCVAVSSALLMECVHPDDRELVRQSVAAAVAGEITYSVDFRVFSEEGEERVLHSEAEVDWDADGKPVRMFGTVQDITERTQAEQEIRVSREQLRELSNHLQVAREQEKASIAREIHDELGGNLTALKMDAFWLARKLPPEMDAAREKIEDMTNLVDASILAMRRIVTELRPTVLDDLGLMAAMRWQASEFSKRYGIQCKVTMHGEEIGMGEGYRIALFRIFQECLTNAARYSKASQVLVDVWRERDKIALDVLDNGIGIPEGAIMQSTSHGIRGMVERTHALGGSVEIGSAPGEGVSISVRIPLDGDVEGAA